MLTLDEQQKVLAALEIALGRVEVRTFIDSTFTPRHQEILRYLPNTLTTPVLQATYVLSWCLNSRWPPPPTPALLDTLLQTLVKADAPTLVPLQARVSQGPDHDPNRQVGNALWVRETMPFFSRAKLRPVIMQLLESDAQPILRIVGPPKSGKSYTRELIEHVCAESRPDIQVVLAEIPEGTGPSYRAKDLADTLVTPTIRNVSDVPADDHSSDYPATLCRFVLNAAINSPGRWIYVLDGFNQPHIKKQTRELVQAFAASIAGTGTFRKRMRLVLVDYPTSLPRVQLGTVLDDTVPEVAELTVAEVEACLLAHYDDIQFRFGRPKPLPNVLQTVAHGLLAKAVQKPEPLNELNVNLTFLRLADLGRPLPLVFPVG